MKVGGGFCFYDCQASSSLNIFLLKIFTNRFAIGVQVYPRKVLQLISEFGGGCRGPDATRKDFYLPIVNQ